jgi:hypothetical protein
LRASIRVVDAALWLLPGCGIQRCKARINGAADRINIENAALGGLQ